MSLGCYTMLNLCNPICTSCNHIWQNIHEHLPFIDDFLTSPLPMDLTQPHIFGDLEPWVPALDDTGSGTPLLRATSRATTLLTEFTLANSCTPSWFLGASHGRPQSWGVLRFNVETWRGHRGNMEKYRLTKSMGQLLLNLFSGDAENTPCDHSICLIPCNEWFILTMEIRFPHLVPTIYEEGPKKCIHL